MAYEISRPLLKFHITKKVRGGDKIPGVAGPRASRKSDEVVQKVDCNPLVDLRRELPMDLQVDHAVGHRGIRFFRLCFVLEFGFGMVRSVALEILFNFYNNRSIMQRGIGGRYRRDLLGT